MDYEQHAQLNCNSGHTRVAFIVSLIYLIYAKYNTLTSQLSLESQEKQINPFTLIDYYCSQVGVLSHVDI